MDWYMNRGVSGGKGGCLLPPCGLTHHSAHNAGVAKSNARSWQLSPFIDLLICRLLCLPHT